MSIEAELASLKAKICAVAEEYQREPRWLRSQTIGKMMDEWIEDAPYASSVSPQSDETGPVVPVCTPGDSEAAETRSGGAA